MKNWERNFLKRIELELESYRVDSIFLPEEGENPDTLRQMFEIGTEKPAVVIMDMAVFSMEDGRQLLQFFTEMVLDVEESSKLLAKINELNLMAPIGAFGYFKQERQLYHKYSLIVKEPSDLEVFISQNIEIIDFILGTVTHWYEELYEMISKSSE